MGDMSIKNTVLIVPPNDPEAVQIYLMAKAMELQIIRSGQPHGATLDREPDVVKLVRDGGWKRVVVIEMPGPKSEEKLRAMGVEVVIIDHHHYTGLDRAHHPKTGKPLPSSLEQFVKLFRLTDARLKKLGFDPWFVRAVGIMDRGFVWALLKEGYKKKDLMDVVNYQRTLMALVRDPKNDEKKQKVAQKAWDAREEWNGFFIVTDKSDQQIRNRISLIAALERGEPTPLIVVEKKRGLIYVQESGQGMKLFETFGGFTFGMDRNWGYRNVKGQAKVMLADVKKILEKR